MQNRRGEDTHGYRLPCKYVIHTAGPIWQDGHRGERELLTACYRNSLELADKYHCESVAFPLISSGVYGYPKAQALKVAMDTITQFLLDHDMTVYIVVFSKDAFEISSKLFKDIEAYIDDVYVDEYLSAPANHADAASAPVSGKGKGNRSGAGGMPRTVHGFGRQPS